MLTSMHIMIHLRLGILAGELSVCLTFLHLIDLLCYKSTFEKFSKNPTHQLHDVLSKKVLFFTLSSQWFYFMFLIQI